MVTDKNSVSDVEKNNSDNRCRSKQTGENVNERIVFVFTCHRNSVTSEFQTGKNNATIID